MFNYSYRCQRTCETYIVKLILYHMNTLECRAHNYERVELKVVRPPLASFKIPQELAGWKRGKLELNICLN